MSHEIHQLEKGFSLSGLTSSVTSFVHTQLDRFEKSVERRVLNPINNYLKTPDEIDADLTQQVNFQQVVVSVEVDGSYGKLKAYKDGYNNIHDLGLINQEFMEENY
ncbi:hypothetical protein LZZ85_23015 [Terrimonas sp. NA20]|uniref:Uncharacterized protein n=1 Tax=Terrimonas ginsenosidimutans TaxID=2908004 RepID=A0ABS9KXZ2_9BACT|nr:hypothetical protein [Terrimonas ginsenosidimutans]MCG2617185.1 hypothetical protein [Terrimonas ginsenosidimutans]